MIRATVITDASFCDLDGTSGWAAWIRIDGRNAPIKKYASFLNHPINSTEAEMLAAINGIYLAKNNGAEYVLLQTDCMAVVYMANGRVKKQLWILKWNNALRKAGLFGFPIAAAHVKGHSKKQDARSYVNRWCDEMANKARKVSRA